MEESSHWNVLSLEAFRFYNCPDCDMKFTMRTAFVEHAIMTHHVSRKFIPNILENNVTITNVTSNDSPQQNTVMKQPNKSVKRKVDLFHQIRNKKPTFSSMKGTQKNLKRVSIYLTIGSISASFLRR